MLFSVVDDRSGVAYLEYRCVYGEDVEAALRFLFNAMSPKPDSADPFQGIPARLYLDNGPVAKSAVFRRVMESLGVEVGPAHAGRLGWPADDGARQGQGRAAVPHGEGGARDALPLPSSPRPKRRRTAGCRASSPPTTRATIAPSRIRASTIGSRTCPADGVRAMCAWERFCAFAREPERRSVGIDCRLTVAGRRLRGRSRARRRDGRGLVGPVRPGALGRAWRGALRALSDPSAARCRSTATAGTARAAGRPAPTRSTRSRPRSACRARRCRARTRGHGRPPAGREPPAITAVRRPRPVPEL